VVKIVSIKYIGNISPCRVRAGASSFNNLRKGDVLEVSDDVGKKLWLNPHFIKVGHTNKKKEEVVEKQEEVDDSFDLNGDGVVDEEDFSIASKTLNFARRQKK